MSRHNPKHWCPNGCGKSVVFDRQNYNCLKCKKTITKKELLKINNPTQTRKNWALTILFFFSYMSVAIAFFLVGFNTDEFGFEKDKMRGDITTEQQYILQNCSTGDLEDDLFCLRYKTFDFFQYRNNTDINILTFDELRENGGDCLDWSRYYKTMLEADGYNAKIVKIHYNNDDESGGHAFVVAWADKPTKYCIIDQTIVRCIS